MADDIPDGFRPNSPEQQAKINDISLRVFKELKDEVAAFAVVFAMPDGTLMTCLAGDLTNIHAMARLFAHGPDNMRITLERALQGKGMTRIVLTDEGG